MEIRIKDKPVQFQLEENGEWYCVGSEVGRYLRIPRGKIYREFPSLWRKIVSSQEKQAIFARKLIPAMNLSCVVLVKASEVEAILNDMGDSLYSVQPEDSTLNNSTEIPQNTAIHEISSAANHHLSPIPTCTDINPNRTVKRNKIRFFPMCNDNVNSNSYYKDDLVSIRIDLEFEGQKLRDVFLWNQNEKLITLDLFSKLLCDELGVNPVFIPAVAHSMNQQISQHRSLNFTESTSEQRVVIKINIQKNNMCLVDQFEWDLSCRENDPELFARTLCADLGIGGDFPSLVAYSIRSQLAHHRKFASKSIVRSGDSSLPPGKNYPFRTPEKSGKWGPLLQTLTEAENKKKTRDFSFRNDFPDESYPSV